MAYQWGYGSARNEPSHADAETAIGELVRTLQQNLSRHTRIRVNEVVKAGSMGHGTTVPGHFDIDLVLYSSDVSGDTINRQGYGSYLEQLRSFLTTYQSGTITEVSTTRFAVQFKYKEYIDVDLLISPVWWEFSPEDPSKLFTFLQDRVSNDDETRHRFSVNASKWQVSFLRRQDQRVKEYITRAKAWRNHLWPESKGGRGRPSSYLLSLLVLRAYENQSGYNPARSTTEELKKIVRNHRRMDIYWEHYYRKGDYPRLFPSSTPRLVDPANPANNVYWSGIGPYPPNKRPSNYERGDGDWSQFVTKVEYFDLEKSVEEISS